ncbi:TetR/AcrR family transcriptional regulator [Luteimonas sp. RD2P54]|uniref:TetR/AcrR family transcriptional regulator n=1 Tax=Luteimonas endophytica TaxID=3042023 RepID=A0ABT6JB72_9GAMM|nr:TetR/AcrR family transcriptional regulator [Luteimonas endophytica]MDH5823852.1 TetR/AcrR family transcriptional regulator [Luteimonas endophytica]
MDSGPKQPPAKPRAAPRLPRRAPGRPAGETPDLRERLLDAALACYVRRGIAATSVRDIAAEAGVTSALVHYYFGDAARLREAVIDQRLLPVFAEVRARVTRAADSDLAALIAGFVDGVCRAVEAHPWFPALWVREVVSEGGALRDLLVTRVAPEMAHLLADRFAKAQARGQLNVDLDPRLLMVSLVGLTLFPAAGAPIWRQLFDAGDLGMEDVRRHALALLDRGLELADGE